MSGAGHSLVSTAMIALMSDRCGPSNSTASVKNWKARGAVSAGGAGCLEKAMSIALRVSPSQTCSNTERIHEDFQDSLGSLETQIPLK